MLGHIFKVRSQIKKREGSKKGKKGKRGKKMAF